MPRPEALIQPSPSDLPTVTVRGFLNFRTTVDGTVIVFTPSSETPQQNQPNQPIGKNSIIKTSLSTTQNNSLPIVNKWNNYILARIANYIRIPSKYSIYSMSYGIMFIMLQIFVMCVIYYV